MGDTDSHMMEPAWPWTRHMAAADKAEAPRMGEAPGSGRCTLYWPQASRLRASKGNYPMTAKASLRAADTAMGRFKRAQEADFSAKSRLLDTDKQEVGSQMLYPTYADQMPGRNSAPPACWPPAAEPILPGPLIILPKRQDGCAGRRLFPCRNRKRRSKRPSASRQTAASAMLYGPIQAVTERSGLRTSGPCGRPRKSGGRPLPTPASAQPQGSCGARRDTQTSGHRFSPPFEALAARAGRSGGGSFENGPHRKVIPDAGDGGWPLYRLPRMEQHGKFSGNAEHEYLTRVPTEYFRSNVRWGSGVTSPP